MRYIILFFILLTSCHREVSATLVIDIKPADTTVKTNISQSPAKLFKSGKFYLRIPRPEYPFFLPKAIKIDSLKKGKYMLEYPDLYGDLIKQNIVVDESKIYHTTIYPDVAKRFSNKNVVSNLKNGEELEIKMMSEGCFHSNSITFQITKLDNKLKVSRNNISKTLNRKEELYITNLENNVRLQKKRSDCTSYECMIFIKNGRNDTISDSGCEFSTYGKFFKFLARNGL